MSKNLNKFISSIDSFMSEEDFDVLKTGNPTRKMMTMAKYIEEAQDYIEHNLGFKPDSKESNDVLRKSSKILLERIE